MEQSIQSRLAQAVSNYQMPEEAVALLAAHPPLILSGVTAAGKDAVAEHMQQDGHYQRVVTTTTRPPREGEQNGKDYWFVSEEQMLRMVEDRAFIEVKWIHDQQMSGSSLKAYNDVLQAGRRPLMRIDIQGITEIVSRLPNLRTIFILPPSLEAWLERLSRRGDMSHVERARRFASAAAELEAALNSRHFMLVTNHEVPSAAKRIISGHFDEPEQQRNRQLAQQLIHDIHSLN